MIYGLLYLAGALLAFWMARKFSSEMRRCRGWPTVPGRIVERGLGPAMGTRGRSYLPHAKYTYTVAGTEYTNDQVYLIRGTGGLADKMRQLVNALPDAVPVHYDPADPGKSYLLVNPRGTYWTLIAVGTLAVLIGVGMILVAITRST